MMGYQSTRIYPEVLRSIASSTISGTFAPIGTALLNSASIVKIINGSTNPVTISWDGINAHDYVPAGSFVLYDFTTNKPKDSPILVAQQGTQFYASGTAGTGIIYLVAFFGNTPAATIPL